MRITPIEVLVICVIIMIVALMALGLTNEEFRARVKHNQYEQRYPCINGIRYIRSKDNLAAMVDPNTMQPQRCGAEQ